VLPRRRGGGDGVVNPLAPGWLPVQAHIDMGGRVFFMAAFDDREPSRRYVQGWQEGLLRCGGTTVNGGAAGSNRAAHGADLARLEAAR